MMKNKHSILTVAQMNEVDKNTIADLLKCGRSGLDLMEEAGLSVVREITKYCDGSRALILCGPGNNGGDGFVIARHLKKAAWKVDVALLGVIDQLRGDAAEMAKKWDGDIKPLTPDVVSGHDVIVDAIFGTGLSKNIANTLKDTIDKANVADGYKIAVDIPSGIKGDTGAILGAAIKVDKTVTFCRKKNAHLLFPGKEYCGDVVVTDIGIPKRIIEDVNSTSFENHPDLWKDELPKHAQYIHKYHRGHAVVVSGNLSHTGASRLAAMAALRIGAGLVSVSSPEDAIPIHAAHLTAVMIRQRNDLQSDLKDDRLNAWCIGPACGITANTKKNVLDIIEADKKIVIDADALSVFEEGPLELFEAINSVKQVQCVLTPHSGEFARIFPYLKSLNKISAAQNAAKLSGAIVLYKGADTVIAAPDGRVVISNNAPATLATAGTGDVLAGILTGLLAQDMPAFEAACAAQWIHSECANELGTGLISEDLHLKISEVLVKICPD